MNRLVTALPLQRRSGPGRWGQWAICGALLWSMARAEELPADRRDAYLARAHDVVVWRAGLPRRADFQAHAAPQVLPAVAAKLLLHEDQGWCSDKIVEIMERPAGDMFWMFQCVHIAYLGRGQLSPAAMAAMRSAWLHYMPLRGDTENHWVMYYASLYLMAQFWPDEAGDRWFTGKSSAENQAEARTWLLRWMDLTTSRGQGEYDCTHYIGEYCISMLMLAAWAADPELRLRGRMMLDYLIADYAIDSLDAMYVGAHARTDDRQVLEKWAGQSSFYGWLLFGNCPTPEDYGRHGWGWGTYFALNAAHYDCPEVIHRIATDRSVSYLHYELKRTRDRWRNSDIRHAPVYKTTYMTREYALGSDQGGNLQPIQQHSWDVTWAVPDPRGVHNTMFAVQPSCSGTDLQTYYTDYPDWMPIRVTTEGKPSYDKEDKFLGGSPYEQVFQQEDALVSLTHVPPEARFGHVNGFFSGDLRRCEEDASGWIFAQGGNAYLAYRPLAPYEWRPMPGRDRRLYSSSRRNGTILQVAASSEFPDWAAFKAAIRALPLRIALEPEPRVEFATLRGRNLVCEYGRVPTVDGRPVDYGRWPLFGGAYLSAERDSRTLTLTHGRLRRVLDFRVLSVTDEVLP